MKHNWEYKRLGDICTVNFGKRIVAKDTTPGPYKVYGGGGATFTTLNFNRENCTIVSRFAMSSNCVRFVKGKFFLNDSGLTIETKIDFLTQGFIDKFLWVNQPLIYGLGRGMAQKNLNVKALLEINVPVPPMEVQERIVAELDKINETIEDCRELLRNLDALAQSLFYDYFGDPIANPKCWKTKPIKSIAPSGESFLEPQELDGKFWLLNLEQVESNSGRILEIEYFPIENIGSSTVNFDEGNVLYSKLRPYLNKVVIPYGRGYCTSELIPLRPNQDYVSREYIAYALRLPEFVKFISAKTGGAKMPRVKMQHFWNFQMPVPPLELQEKFAERIEQIEEQKKDVENTIAELQTLLDSRMDYWFN